jgi:predicted nucleotidyltransferase
MLRGFLDRDFITTQEGFLFCVIGGIHPTDRVISYLKYRPEPHGRWGRTTRYHRTMKNYTVPSLQETLHLIQTQYPQYLYRSRIFDTRISVVPKQRILQHHQPEAKLVELFELAQRDSLQSSVIELVSTMSHQTGISPRCFGVTGSILTDIHQPSFSDIDLTVYGLENGWKMQHYLQDTLLDNSKLFTRHCPKERKQVLTRWSQRYPLTVSEAEHIYLRRWNYGFFHDTAFSIHPIQLRREIESQYGDQRFHSRRMVEGSAKIVDVEQSLFLPAIYEISDFNDINEGNHVVVRQLVSYNGLYNGIFKEGETVHLRGKLEKVEDKQRKLKYYRILVGSLLAKGQDYIKPTER